MRPVGLASLAVPILVGGLAAGCSGPTVREPPVEAEAALREGNRRFREGRLEAAVEAYRRGIGAGEAQPVLAYNLGTALHRLGRLPEAVLWYRRAEAAGSADPWLTENLERARAELEAVRAGPPPPLGPLLLHPWLAGVLAALLAWGALLTALLAPSSRRRGAAWLLIASLAAWVGSVALVRLGPRPAVLLSGCGPSLPAGSEVWVVREPKGAFRVAGTGTRCPADAVAPLDGAAAPARP